MSPARSLQAVAVLVVSGLSAGCTGGSASPPAVASATPTVTALTKAPASSPPADAAAAFERALRAKLALPALPSFAVPTDLLTSSQDRRVSALLKLSPGLYQGIAVLDARCDSSGRVRPVDGGGSARGPAAPARYDAAGVRVRIAGDGTGRYDAGALHVAVLRGGRGTYDDGTTRLTVTGGGAGTYTGPGRRLTVRPDGSGSYRDADTSLFVQPDGTAGYDGPAVHVSVAADGRVFSRGDSGTVAAVRRVLRGRLPRFPPVPVLSRVAARGRSCGTVIRLDANVLFDFGVADVRPDRQALLRRVAALLVALRQPAAQVDGHTDHIGDARTNLALSTARADRVRAALEALGVRAGRLRAKGYGSTRPLARETRPDGRDDPAARQLDRRVEIVLRAG